ncbi:transposase [Janthinobacterium sp. 17J80-10]|uniref:IS66-like element accessory protein TnpA n=1 Tax=Janthinobacterium sp. 17J80-10 TaxID=2497863 RepID=UPI00100546D8|nr:transposase [Janthinobacterium sp. 17J80-10]QAU34908.1 transposase [Janthinobacterium sp. 17J80-10]
MSQSGSRCFLVGTTLDTTIKQGNRKGRPNHPLEFKKHLAQAACEPGVSVSRLAREHGINANMLFKWRRHYRAGLFDSTASSALLPVVVADAGMAASPSLRARHGQIEITFAGAVIRIEGGADADTTTDCFVSSILHSELFGPKYGVGKSRSCGHQFGEYS